MQEPQVHSLGREETLEEEMATHSSILAWRIPWTEEPGGLQFTGLQRDRHDWSNLACSTPCGAYIKLFTDTHGEGDGTPLQYSCLENPMAEEPGRLQSMGLLRVRHDWETSLSLFTFIHWRRKWQPTPVFLPGESQGRRSLVGCRLGSHRVGHDWNDLAA